MEEPARLVCPQCALVYRLRKYTPGRAHYCKTCGTQLRNPDGTEAAPPSPSPARDSVRAAPGGSDLSRLPGLVERLTARLDELQGSESGEDGAESPVESLMGALARLEEETARAAGELGGKIQELDEKFRNAVGEKVDEKVTAALGGTFGGELDEKLQLFADGLAGRLALLDEKIAAAQTPSADAVGKEEVSALKNALEAVKVDLARRIDDFHAALAANRDDAEKTTVEVDIDELADRLVAGVSGRGPVYDAETGTAVDALARLADQLVREQNANTSRLDRLADEIHGAVANIAKLEEWQTELPDRVADEIGATVESRVVGPISGALARQAPSILSDLQDNKLVDIVSRSVREAQRPLLREILAGGRNGVPVWLFASVLLPLLLILGYLLLPGEMGGRGGAGASVPAEVTDALVRMETAGVPLSPDAEDRLAGIEEAVLDIHDQALAHVRNAAALEEEGKNLRRLLEERDRIIAEYAATLERQTKRLQAYEFRLVQLGVKPDAIAGQ